MKKHGYVYSSTGYKYGIFFQLTCEVFRSVEISHVLIWNNADLVIIKGSNNWEGLQ
jgi:uncharacterized protein with ATP-grasp and redox domains